MSAEDSKKNTDDNQSKLTPAMAQYQEVLDQYPFPEYTLLFQMGDFFECFFDNAVRVAQDLSIMLTARGKVNGEDIPMAGFPLRQLNHYVSKLLEKKRRVVVVEQIQDPSEAVGVVDRAVTQVITPGTIFDENLLEADCENYIISINTIPLKKNYKLDSDLTIGFSWADLSSGSFYISEMKIEDFLKELVRISPSEIIVPDKFFYDDADGANPLLKEIKDLCSCTFTPLEELVFDQKQGYRKLVEQFKVKNLESFECEDLKSGIGAAGSVLIYFERTQKNKVNQLIGIRRVYSDNRMMLDSATIRCLELAKNMRSNSRNGTLLSVLDLTMTPMGARTLRQWLLAPLLDLKEINTRLDAVEELFTEIETRLNLRDALKGLGDLERLIGRIANGRSNPKDYAMLRDSLKKLPEIKSCTEVLKTSLLSMIDTQIDQLGELETFLSEALAENPSSMLREGGIFHDGYNSELDEFRQFADQGENYIQEFQKRERKRTKIPKLKVSSNKVFGFYIEVTNTYKDKIPQDYRRIQTIKNAERYVTNELKLYEQKTLSAQKKAEKLEYTMFVELRKTVADWIPKILNTAKAIAVVDALQSLGYVAQIRRYVRPQFTDENHLNLRNSRHPVVEVSDIEGDFIANDCDLSHEKPVMILTGPNMSGKSTFIRQIALVALMAQVGSFVPASQAKLSICDRIFTRISTGDELSRGQSTFMVEMSETANILNNATSRSLIVLDEVGRGTSTFDGLSIAWAIVEYINEFLGARTLFATHYHELPTLSTIYPTIQCSNVLVEEIKDKVLFHHKIVAGSSDKSYGIYVGQIAGLPAKVVKRAGVILKNVEQKSLDAEGKPLFVPRVEKKKKMVQLKLFLPAKERIAQLLKKTAINNLTEEQAKKLLADIKDLSTQPDDPAF